MQYQLIKQLLQDVHSDQCTSYEDLTLQQLDQLLKLSVEHSRDKLESERKSLWKKTLISINEVILQQENEKNIDKKD